MIQAEEDPFGAAPAVAVKRVTKARAIADATVPAGYTGPIEFVIFGQPASKANSRQIVTIAGRPSSIKSKEALAYERDALRQIPSKHRLQLAGLVSVTLRIFYATERPDLDESIVLDVMQNRYVKGAIPGQEKLRVLLQAGVYVNDRQVREKHVYHAIDRLMPRTEVRIELIGQGQLL